MGSKSYPNLGTKSHKKQNKTKQKQTNTKKLVVFAM